MEYNEQYKNDTIKLILNQLDDLETWSAYNDDKHMKVIQELKYILEAMTEKTNESEEI